MKKETVLSLFKDYLRKAEEADHAHNYSLFVSLNFNQIAAGTPFESGLSQYTHLLNVLKDKASNPIYPDTVKAENFTEIVATLHKAVNFLETDSHIPAQKIDNALINKVSDNKVRKICEEINREPNENHIAIISLTGIAIQWTIFFKAKAGGYQKIDKDIYFKPLIEYVVDNDYYGDTQVNKFLRDYKNNFRKTSYDGIKHSQNYIPDMTQVNDDIRLLVLLLEKTF